MKKVNIQVFIKENNQSQCAKCCKTINVVDRMIEAFPEFKDQINVQYYEDSPDETANQHRELQRPVVIVNDMIFSYGHVPIIKKLSREVINLLNRP